MSVAAWVGGARPRTLPAAIAPVLAGLGVAVFSGPLNWTLAALCLLVALALQVGVNYANDYSDGIRGTDADRVGPQRLVGSGLARPRTVLAAALACFVVAAAAGLGVAVVSGQLWLLGVGAAAIAAAWFYTGGPRPYGYLGLGEVFVFVFFGLVATGGTAWVQLASPSGLAVARIACAGSAIGLLACAILMANNIRDIAGDSAAGKRTLAVRLGGRRARVGYAAMIAGAALCCVALAALSTWWVLLALAFLVVAAPAARDVVRGATGPALIGVLKRTGLAELVCAAGMLAGFAVG